LPNLALSAPLSAGSTSENHKLARLAGWLYLLTFPTTGAWYGISGTLLAGDTVTLASLEAGRGMLALAILLGAVGSVNHLALVVVLHRLLSPFGKVAANLAVIFLAASVPLTFMAIAREMDLLALLDRAPTLALGAEQVQAQITLTIDAYTSLFNTQTVFWGVWLLPLGWLLLRSRYVPKVLAVALLLGGPFYMMAFVGAVLDPGYATSLFGRMFGLVTGVPELIGEVGTALWLTIRGSQTVHKKGHVDIVA
jgi:hypothetical protein